MGGLECSAFAGFDRRYLRFARWFPRDGTGWDKLENLFRDVDRLNQEKPSAPAPDDHVH